jgi:uncharacterized protein (TIRG00374 family)
MRHHGLKIAVSIGLAVALLGAFLWRAPLADVGAQLARVHLGLVIASALTALLSYFLRALRWGLILRPLGRPEVGDLWGCTAAGFATSTVLPARAGELVRPVLLSMRTSLPAAGCIASIVTERLADLTTVIALFGVGVLTARHRLAAAWLTPLTDAAVLVAAGLAVAFAAAWLLLRHREGATAWAVRLVPARWRSSVTAFIHHVLDGLQVIRSPLRLLQLASWSLVLWLVIGLQVAFLAAAFDFSLSPGQIAVMIAVSVIGLAVPTPGGVGGFHAAVQFALNSILGVPLAVASAFALVHHAVCFFPITAIGLVHIAGYGLSLGRARALGESAERLEEGS